MKIEDHLRAQIAFSSATFGPGTRTDGVLDHIAKEIKEVREDPSIEEWIDLVILALDGAWRCAMFRRQGHDAIAFRSPREAAREVESALHAKLDANITRAWPNWRDLPANQAIEHVRTGEPGGDADG